MSSLLLSCLKIFLCRILDVTLGSIKTVLVVREKALVAACFGFFEVFIWYIVVKDAMSSTDAVIPLATAYALGYATGTFVGGSLAKRLIGGKVTIHVVTSDRNPVLPMVLREAGFGITVLGVQESDYGGEKNLILAEFDKKDLERFKTILKDADPDAFVIVQETKSTLGGYYKRPGK